MKRTFFLIVLIAFQTFIALSQTDSLPKKRLLSNHYQRGVAVWAGPSLSTGLSYAGVEGAYNNYTFGIHHFYHKKTEYLITPKEYNQSDVIYFGVRRSKKHTSISLTAGVGRVEMLKRTGILKNGLISTTYNSTIITTAGIELALKGTFNYRNNGVGVLFNANLNPESPFVGGYIFIQTGWNWKPLIVPPAQ